MKTVNRFQSEATILGVTIILAVSAACDLLRSFIGLDLGLGFTLGAAIAYSTVMTLISHGWFSPGAHISLK